VVNALFMTTRLTNGLRQGNNDVPEKRRGWPGPFPGRKRQHIRRLVTMTKGSIQAPHPDIADDLKTQKRLGFADCLQDMSGELLEGAEAKGPPRQPHADHNRH
jgi:hypothetical protein